MNIGLFAIEIFGCSFTWFRHLGLDTSDTIYTNSIIKTLF